MPTINRGNFYLCKNRDDIFSFSSHSSIVYGCSLVDFAVLFDDHDSTV